MNNYISFNISILCVARINENCVEIFLVQFHVLNCKIIHGGQKVASNLNQVLILPDTKGGWEIAFQMMISSGITYYSDFSLICTQPPDMVVIFPLWYWTSVVILCY